jgi:hypothetical protein
MVCLVGAIKEFQNTDTYRTSTCAAKIRASGFA